MKRIFLIIYFLIIYTFLSGCSSIIDDNNLINNKLLTDQISHIEIKVDDHKKVVTDLDEINLIISFIENIQSLNDSMEDIQCAGEDNIARIAIYDKADSVAESISIFEEAVYYNKKWHSSDKQTYGKVKTLYKEIESEELVDEIQLNIKQRRSSRKEKPLAEALNGIWVNENESRIKFVNNHLKQGQQYKYVFKYVVDKAYDDALEVSIYGINGFFIEGKKLSNNYIIMNSTKTQMVMKTQMVGDITYYDKYIYIDEDGLRLGSFDSFFFFENAIE